MISTFKRMEELFNSIQSLPDLERRFICEYIEDACRDLGHGHTNGDHLNLQTFWQQNQVRSFEELAKSLLEWVYNNDNYHDVSKVTGLLYGSLPKTIDCEKILLKGVLNPNKSNRLRERFFWVFNYNFKESVKYFFENDFGKFLNENSNNEDICADIISFLHWTMEGSKHLENVKNQVQEFLNKHPKVKNGIHQATKRILSIE